MSPTTYAQYVKAMEENVQGTVTFNWDVAVTYEASKINALLAKEHEKPSSRMPSKVLLEYEYEDFDDNKIVQHYDLKLGPPLIQFNADTSNPTCSLQMLVLSGSLWKVEVKTGKRSETTQLEANAYSIQLSNLNLGSVTASDKPSPVKSGSHLITFPDTSTTEQIVVDFVTKNEHVGTSIIYHKGENSNMPSPMKKKNLLEVLHDYFQNHTSSIDYTLALINNTKPAAGTTLDLVPRSFCLVCTGTATKSYLTLLIQTKGSTVNANTTGIQSQWDGLWSGTLKVDPVPQDQTASIIINKSFLVQHYLKAALSAHATVGFASMEPVTLEAGKSGFCLEFTWKTIFVKGETISHSTVDSNGVYMGGEGHKVDDRTIDPNSGGEKLNILFSQSDGPDKPPTAHMKWSYKDKTKWSSWMQFVSQGGLNTRPTSEGVIDGSWKLDKSVVLTGNNLNQESFIIKLGIGKSDWSFTKKAESADLIDAIKRVTGFVPGKSEDMPPFASALAGEYITFDLDFGALRFFSITNVLLPGKKVIDIDIKAGLRIPNDLVLVGKVVE